MTDAEVTSGIRAHIRACTFWTPGFASYSDFVSGIADPDLVRPPIPIVQSRMKRATSLMTRMAVDVAVRAAESAGFSLDDLATVFGSEHGEIQIAVAQMAMMRDGEGQISPARFKNSVHNTAAGLFSIAAKNKGFATAIAAGPDTFPMCLVEAIGLLKTGEAQNVIVSMSDETLPAPLDRFSDHEPLAIGLALSASGPGPVVSMPQSISRMTTADGDKSIGILPEFERHAATPAWRLLAAVQEGRTGWVALNNDWSVRLG